MIVNEAIPPGPADSRPVDAHLTHQRPVPGKPSSSDWPTQYLLLGQQDDEKATPLDDVLGYQHE
jgi:hypothetical protein